MIIETKNAKETYDLGKKIGSHAKAGEVYTLVGDLGVGKTVQIMLPLGGAETANDAGQSENEQKIINIE